MLLDGGDYDNGIGNEKSAGPRTFNVIDTSNLTDHVGLLNLLISTVPCLRKSRSSTIITESLLNKGPGSGQVETFSSLLQADQTTMFLLFGLAPVSYLTGVSMLSTAMESAHAILGINQPSKNQFQRRVEWKAPNLGEFSNRHLRVDAKALAKFLFALYLDMFSVEGLVVLQDLDISELSKLAVIHYTRSGFADLILFLSSKINVDWPSAISLLLDYITADDTLLVGTSNIQDLYVQLYLRDLYTIPSLASPPREISDDLPPLRASGPGILAQHSVGPIVSVNLIVPREAVDALTNFDTAIIGTPALRAEISGPGWQNFFSSIQIGFGRVVEYDAKSIEFQEDPQGWRGRNHMMISFLAPAWMLLLESEDSIKISLDIQSTPGTSDLIHKFGIQLKIYEATLDDQDHVIIASQLPKLSQIMLKVPNMTEIAENVNELISGVSVHEPEALFHRDCKAIEELKILLKVEDDSKKAILAIRDTAVAATQRDPWSILVTFGGWSEPLIYPFPVNAASSRLRVSRKQSYIEVHDSKYSVYRALT
jgi:hypothetical protein